MFATGMQDNEQIAFYNMMTHIEISYAVKVVLIKVEIVI